MGEWAADEVYRQVHTFDVAQRLTKKLGRQARNGRYKAQMRQATVTPSTKQ
jgi:hypothetical protein